MAQIKKWTPCIIAWEDAVTTYDPARSDDKFPTAYRKSVGFLIRRDNTAVTIAMEDDRNADTGDDDCQTVTVLPTGMIRSITVLTPGETINTRRKRVKKKSEGLGVYPAPEPQV